jgi:peptide/nickel transport system permease protein
MIPTFFGISLVVFLVLNLAPGHPGAAQRSDDSATIRGAAAQESYRIFREQFSLEKPALFNLRFGVTETTVADDVTVVAGLTQADAAQRIHAQDELEDLGRFAVPHLLSVAVRAQNDLNSAVPNTARNTPLRDTALGLLQLAALRPLQQPFLRNPPPALRAVNREIDRQNNEIRSWQYPRDADEATKLESLAHFKQWYAIHAQDYQYTFGDKLRIFFFDTRFAVYWKNLARLDFGVSLVSREPVLDTLIGKLKYSLSLSVGSLILAYLLAIPLGIFSAVKHGSRADSSVTVVLFLLYSLPTFFVATVLLVLFSRGSDWPALRIFPTGGWQSSNAADLSVLESVYDIGWHLVLPMFCMTYGLLAALSRYMRSGLLEVIRSDYVRTARAKGLTEARVIGKHAVRNGLMPIITLLAGLLPAAVGGSVIVEYIFGIPGMGLWMVESIYQRDYNVIMAVQLLSTVLVLVGILLTDLGYALVDPRIRYS